MPAAAISSSIAVAAKPFAMTAASASASRRSFVSLVRLGDFSSMANCTMSPVDVVTAPRRRLSARQSLSNTLNMLRKINSLGLHHESANLGAGKALGPARRAPLLGADQKDHRHEQIPQQPSAAVEPDFPHRRRSGNHPYFPRRHRTSAFRQLRSAEVGGGRGAAAQLQ